MSPVLLVPAQVHCPVADNCDADHTGAKRAFCFGPEDTVSAVKKEIFSKDFDKTRPITLKNAKGEEMENMKPLEAYNVAKGDVLFLSRA